MRFLAQSTSVPAGEVPFLDLERIHAPLRERFDRAWRQVLDESAFIGGHHVDSFEAAFAEHAGARHAVGVANGTDALHLVLRALGVGPGDEVIVPANTFVATAEAVVLAGARPCFVDVDDATLLMRADAIEAALTPRTAAVIPVHLYGQVADMPTIQAVADRHGLLVVEDAAQAHGAAFGGRRAGTFGIAGCFSFYPGKNLGALGDGGAVLTDDDHLAERVRSIANHGRSGTSKYDHPNLGTNSRLDGLQAAMLEIKLEHLDRWNQMRREASAGYRQRLAGAPVRFVEQHPDGQGVHHLEVVRVPARDQVRQRLHDRGIATGVHYPVPVHQLQPFRSPAPMPVAERAKDEILSLPMFPGITEAELTAVAEALSEVVSEMGPSEVAS